MNLYLTEAALRDELQKIAEVRLDGLSPETVMSLRAPEPMATPGLQRAREILSRAELSKTANMTAPDIEQASAQDRKINTFRDAGKRTLTGAGVGRLLSEVSLKTSGNISPIRRTIGTAIGATAGLADHFVERRYQRRKAERDMFRRGMAPAQPVQKVASVPPELEELERERKFRELADRNPLVDSGKLRSKAKAMRVGSVVGAIAAPLALAAMAAKPAVRAAIIKDWKEFPLKTGLTYGSALAGLSGVGSKVGSLIAGKAHDIRHGPVIKEKRSSVQDPSYRLKKTQSAYKARDALTAIRNETVVPRKP